jgi:hypothetical protein
VDLSSEGISAASVSLGNRIASSRDEGKPSPSCKTGSLNSSTKSRKRGGVTLFEFAGEIWEDFK